MARNVPKCARFSITITSLAILLLTFLTWSHLPMRIWARLERFVCCAQGPTSDGAGECVNCPPLHTTSGRAAQSVCTALADDEGNDDGRRTDVVAGFDLNEPSQVRERPPRAQELPRACAAVRGRVF
jgi:hypothetical protein